ncbi:unnamed protein product [Staurois parvus]|uniref:Secreted protein n=1 Tax=Staurois parvus TaxID=386267 RepID=A0ABN9GJ22_9NEOB|nr:unnamed protein product [Staurois parvus]
MGGGTPCRFLFIMVLVFKCNFPFFFFTIAQKFTCHFPQLKEKVFLEYISLKETMFTLSFLKDTKFSVTSGKVTSKLVNQSEKKKKAGICI